MFAIYLSACLVRDPHVCRDYKLQSDEAVNSMGCMAQAPLQFGRWSEQHPGWQISRWRCGPMSEDKI